MPKPFLFIRLQFNLLLLLMVTRADTLSILSLYFSFELCFVLLNEFLPQFVLFDDLFLERFK